MRPSILFAFLLLPACAGDPVDDVALDQGAYGQLTSSSDVAGQSSEVIAGAAVTAYAAEAPHVRIAAITSDEDGVYELALGEGSYVVCSLAALPESLFEQWQHNCAGGCTRLEIPAGRVRADWSANQSGGWWTAGEHCVR